MNKLNYLGVLFFLLFVLAGCEKDKNGNSIGWDRLYCTVNGEKYSDEILVFGAPGAYKTPNTVYRRDSLLIISSHIKPDFTEKGQCDFFLNFHIYHWAWDKIGKVMRFTKLPPNEEDYGIWQLYREQQVSNATINLDFYGEGELVVTRYDPVNHRIYGRFEAQFDIEEADTNFVVKGNFRTNVEYD